jgi:hypothetical protein
MYVQLRTEWWNQENVEEMMMEGLMILMMFLGNPRAPLREMSIYCETEGISGGIQSERA